MPVPNERLPGRSTTSLDARSRYTDDLAAFKSSRRTTDALEARIAAIEYQLANATPLPFVAVVQTLTNYTIPDAWYHVRCDTTGGNITVTLPSASGKNGKIISITKILSAVNTVTIVQAGGEFLIVPAGGDVLAAVGDSLTVIGIDYNANVGWEIF